MTIQLISLGHFSGGRNLSERGDTDPGERQLDDLIVELQTDVNAANAAAGTHAARHITGGGDTIASAVPAGAAGLMTGADKTKLDGIEAGADVTDAANVGTAGAAMRTGMAAVGDIITAASVAPVVQGNIAAGAVGTVLAGNGVGSVPSFQAASGLDINKLEAEGIDLEMHTNDDELDITLLGNAAKKASAMHLLVQVTGINTVPGALAGDSEIKVGTSSDGNQILAATVLGAGMNAVGKQIKIPIASTTMDLAGNGHVYVRCDKADTTVTSLIVKVRLVLEQF
jgi:hypothetical protein